MRVRYRSSSSSLEEDFLTRPSQHRTRYVRRRPSPRRNTSYERRRPPDHGPEGGGSHRRSTTPSDDSDDDTVYKVDRHGRRQGRSSQCRPRSSMNHDGYREPPYMSGALPSDSSEDSDYRSSTTSSSRTTGERHTRWSTTEGPVKIDTNHPRRGRAEEYDDRRHRRCYGGKPKSRRDHRHRGSRRASRSREAAPSRHKNHQSRSMTPRGILRNSSSERCTSSRLRKSVSFERGTKMPDDFEEKPEMSSPVEERLPSPRPGGESIHPDIEPKVGPGKPPEAFEEPEMQQSNVELEEAVPVFPTDIESPDSDGWHSCQRSHSSKGSKCRRCYHCPESRPHRKKSTKQPRMRTWRPKLSRLSPDEQKLRSVAHSILLSTHQPWCEGDCGNLTRFVRRRGGCLGCGQRIPDANRPSDGRSFPNCRTLIHCHQKGHSIFPTARRIRSFDSVIDQALRLGFADVYCCYVGAFLTPEQYLAYRIGGIDATNIRRWVQDHSIQQQIKAVERLGCQAVRVPDVQIPESRFLVSLAEEVEKTTMLWSRVMECARRNRWPFGETSVLRVLEEMARA